MAVLRRLDISGHMPAISTVHAVLDRHGLVARRKRRGHKAQGTTLSTPHRPNDLWCADYKGEFTHLTLKKETIRPAARNFLQQQSGMDP